MTETCGLLLAKGSTEAFGPSGCKAQRRRVTPILAKREQPRCAGHRPVMAEWGGTRHLAGALCCILQRLQDEGARVDRLHIEPTIQVFSKSSVQKLQAKELYIGRDGSAHDIAARAWYATPLGRGGGGGVRGLRHGAACRTHCTAGGSARNLRIHSGFCRPAFQPHWRSSF